MRPMRPSFLLSRWTRAPGRRRSYRTTGRGARGDSAGSGQDDAEWPQRSRAGTHSTGRCAPSSSADVAGARSVADDGVAAVRDSGAGETSDRAALAPPRPHTAVATFAPSAARLQTLVRAGTHLPPAAVSEEQVPVDGRRSIVHSCGYSQVLWQLPVKGFDNSSL